MSLVLSARRIGMGEAQGASGDVLLRAIKDAYDRWIIDEGAKAQLKAINAQMDGKYISKAGTAFGKALGKFTGPFEDMVKTVFASLEEAQQMIEGGGLTLPRLSAEAAYDLVTLLAKGQPTPVVAVLNQWEDGSRLKEDVETLKAFLDNLREWPNFHVVLHLRNPHLDDEDHIAASKLANTLARLPGAESIEVGPIDFENDPTAYENVIAWLAAEFPALAAMEAGDHTADLVMEMIRGNPAVLDEWWYLDDDGSTSIERMGAVADDAQALLYPELWKIYRGLLQAAINDDARVPALEVALIAAVWPLPPSASERAQIMPAVQGRATAHDLRRLASTRLFRDDDGLQLSLGHPSRREAAERGILGLNRKLTAIDPDLATGLAPYLDAALDRVARGLISLHPSKIWNRLDPRVVPTLGVFVAISDHPSLCTRSQILMSACMATRSILRMPYDCEALLVQVSCLDHAPPAVRCLLALGLNNAVVDSGEDSARSDRLLEGLHILADSYPHDTQLREQYSKALFNAITDCAADFERTDRLLARLRRIALDPSADADSRDRFARGINNAIADSGNDSARSDRLLRCLDSLAMAHSEEERLREHFAAGLYNAIIDSESNYKRADMLIDELLRLSEHHDGEPELVSTLACAYGVAIQIAVGLRDLSRAVHFATSLVPFRSIVHNQTDRVHLFQHSLLSAAALAVELGDLDGTRSLGRVYEALYGENDSPREPASPAADGPNA